MPLFQDLSGGRRTDGRKTTRACVSPGAERFGNPLGAALIRFHNRKRYVHLNQPRSVSRNEKQL